MPQSWCALVGSGNSHLTSKIQLRHPLLCWALQDTPHKESVPGTSLVVQWLRVCLRTQVRSPGGELRSKRQWATRESPRAAILTQDRQKKKEILWKRALPEHSPGHSGLNTKRKCLAHLKSRRSSTHSAIVVYFCLVPSPWAFARAEPDPTHSSLDPRGQICVFQVSLLRDGNVSKNTENSLPKINTPWAVPGGSGAGTLLRFMDEESKARCGPVQAGAC